MRRLLLPGLMVTLAAAAAGCGKSEKAGPPAVSEVSSSAPAVTPDPRPPLAMLNTPGNGEAIANGIWCTGWAIDDSGIFQVTGSVDGGPPVPARIGMPFPGVKEAYPNVKDNDKGGFMFLIPNLAPGPHSLRVEVLALDGGKTYLTRDFSIK